MKRNEELQVCSKSTSSNLKWNPNDFPFSFENLSHSQSEMWSSPYNHTRVLINCLICKLCWHPRQCVPTLCLSVWDYCHHIRVKPFKYSDRLNYNSAVYSFRDLNKSWWKSAEDRACMHLMLSVFDVLSKW